MCKPAYKDDIRLLQEKDYFEESEVLLDKAIALITGSPFPSTPAEQNIDQYQTTPEEVGYSPASAYCLLAQSKENNESANAFGAWIRCCQLADITKIEEDVWLFESRSRIKQKKMSPEQLSCNSITPE